MINYNSTARQVGSNRGIAISYTRNSANCICTRLLRFDIGDSDMRAVPSLPLGIVVGINGPSHTFSFTYLPGRNINLTHLRFVVGHVVNIRPHTLLRFSSRRPRLRGRVHRVVGNFSSPHRFCINHLARKVTALNTTFCPGHIVIHLSSFGSGRCTGLINNRHCRPSRRGPVLNFHNTNHCISSDFHSYFTLRYRTIGHIHGSVKLAGIRVVVPFIHAMSRTGTIIRRLTHRKLGHNRGKLGVVVVYRVPSGTLLTRRFLRCFSNFSVNSGSVARLTLNLSHSSNIISRLFSRHGSTIGTLLSVTVHTTGGRNGCIKVYNRNPSSRRSFTT